MNGGLQANSDTSGDEGDEPGDSESLALIEQILLSGDMSIPKNLIPHEIEEEVDDAIDDIVDDEEDSDSIEDAVDSGDARLESSASEISAYHSANIASYWNFSDDEALNTYYDDKDKYDVCADYSAASIAQETEDIKAAATRVYDAKVCRELGLSADEDSDLSAKDREQTMMFKIMHPGLWKWMYEVSTCMSFS
jgi:hypothetical protein